MTFRTDQLDFQARRAEMVEHQLRARNFRDERVMSAMLAVPRHLFVPPDLVSRAYDDVALPIGFEQTISQPYIVALILEALELEGDERVLDVGTGSGYQAALMGTLAREVHSIEIVPELVGMARRALERIGCNNVRVSLGNGSIGLPEEAPYDAIAVAAAAPRVPGELVEQLAEGGRLVIPVGEAWGQTLHCVRKLASGVETRAITPCAFVPLIGKRGW